MRLPEWRVCFKITNEVVNKIKAAINFVHSYSDNALYLTTRS